MESYYRNAGGGDIIILHDFHTDIAGEMNFRVIRELINSGYEVGYTPQGRKDWLDYMAIGLGAKFVEKGLHYLEMILRTDIGKLITWMNFRNG